MVSDYGSINNSEGRISKQNRKLSKRAIKVKEQVSEAFVCRLQIKKRNYKLKFKKRSKGLQLYQKETSTHAFSCEICKFSQNNVFTEQLQWLLMKFNSCFQRSPEQKPVGLSAINTIFSCKKVFAATAVQKEPPQVFCKRRFATLSLEVPKLF